MFTSVDKALQDFVIATIAILVGMGVLSEDIGLTIQNVMLGVGGAALKALITYLIPNKA